MKTQLFITSVLTVGANAFWRLHCPGQVGLARVDPLVNPGEPAQHVHAIHGSSGFSEKATFADITAPNTCTSCSVTQDKSVYWAPAFYFKDGETGEYEVVNQKGGMLVYYLLRDGKGGFKVKAFPPGFAMIAGDSLRRSYSLHLGDVRDPDPGQSGWAALQQTNQRDLAERAIGFNCLHYARNYNEGTLERHFLPTKDYLDGNCEDGIRFEIVFPSCWNGKDLNSPNHKDHMAYPDLIQDGGCPESHPVRLVTLMYEIIYDSYAFKGRNGTFVIANGDIQGYGLHGDFQSGWDEGLLQSAIDQCTSLDGNQEDCKIFNLQSDDKARECKMPIPSILRSEEVTKPGKNLPGGVQIQYGPDRAVAGPGPVPVFNGNAPIPGQVFQAAEPSQDAGLSVNQAPAAPSEDPKPTVEAPAPPPTVEAPPPPPVVTPPPPPPPAEKPVNPNAIRTEYITKDNIVSEIVYEEKLVYVTEEVVATSTVVVEAPPVKRAIRGSPAHMHRHRHAHGHQH